MAVGIILDAAEVEASGLRFVEAEPWHLGVRLDLADVWHAWRSENPSCTSPEW
jgi:hypothetical protein